METIRVLWKLRGFKAISAIYGLRGHVLLVGFLCLAFNSLGNPVGGDIGIGRMRYLNIPGVRVEDHWMADQ
jgi:hypothetical protein